MVLASTASTKSSTSSRITITLRPGRIPVRPLTLPRIPAHPADLAVTTCFFPLSQAHLIAGLSALDSPHADHLWHMDGLRNCGPRKHARRRTFRKVTVRSSLRQHSLSLFFGAIFVLALGGQSVAGLLAYNEDQRAHGQPLVSFGEFITSSNFVVDVAENWQSEYLQFFLFILATIWLVQRGSPESKKPGDAGIGSDADQLVGEHASGDSPRLVKLGGWRQTIYSSSLLLVMGGIFFASWLIQSLAGTVVFNEDQAAHGLPQITWPQYLVVPDFWNRTLQNWQS